MRSWRRRPTSPIRPVGHLVWGIWGHRGEAVVPAARLVGHALPPDADPLAGVFARVGAIALNAVHAADVHLGDQVAVFGQGVIGLLATRLAVLSGAPGGRRRRDPGPPRTRHGATARRDVRRRRSGSRRPSSCRKRIEGADTAIELSGSTPGACTRRSGPSARAAGSWPRGFYQGDGVGLRLGEEFHHNQVQLVSSQIGGVASWLAHRWDVERLQRTFMELGAHGRAST